MSKHERWGDGRKQKLNSSTGVGRKGTFRLMYQKVGWAVVIIGSWIIAGRGTGKMLSFDPPLVPNLILAWEHSKKV